METKQMTGQESLDLIVRMIQNTRDNLERGGGKPFLVWGYATVVVSVAVWTVYTTTLNPAWMWLWFAIPVLGSLGMAWVVKSMPKRVTTYIDRVVGSIWMVIGICAGLAALFSLLSGLIPGPRYSFPILFVEGLLLNAGVVITGLVIRIRYVAVLGALGILLAFGQLFVVGINQILLFAAMAFVTMVIPGHIMNYQGHRISALKE